MNIKRLLLNRLSAANPGWPEWHDLLELVKSQSFELVEDQYLGRFIVAELPLTFSVPGECLAWPAWLPHYVQALLGMKAAAWEMAGGYADSFSNQPTVPGSVFSPAGNDEQLGFPLIEVPCGVFNFQSNSSGALFFINESLEVLYPNSSAKRFEVLDSLETFTRKNIKQVLHGEPWFGAYSGLKGTLLD